MALDIEDLRRRADAGSATAQSVLGTCYLQGTDVEVNYQEALGLLTAAANKGASRAVVNLGRMYEEGLGIQKNVGEAVRLYKSVATQSFSR